MFKTLLSKIKVGQKEGVKHPTLRLQGDLTYIIKGNLRYFAQLESDLSHKPLDEVLQEIRLGLKIFNYPFLQEKKIQNQHITIISPKYELWTYLLFALKLIELGYSVNFIYHNWSRPLVKLIQPNLLYLKYRNLYLHNIDDFDRAIVQNTFLLNFFETYRGIKNTVPDFSTVYIGKDIDLDYCVAYILANSFLFAGLKKSNVKRILVEKEIEEAFLDKFQQRISSQPVVKVRIRSAKIRETIHELVSEGISMGGDILYGKSNSDELFHNNVVLKNVNKDSRIYQKKFYGPILLISSVALDDKESLTKTITRQPSKGIVLFSNDRSLEFPYWEKFKTNKFIYRPALKPSKFSLLVENTPSLEVAFEMIGLE